jgi:hypothetical protein
MTKRISFIELTHFNRLLTQVHAQFGPRLCTHDKSQRLQARSEAIEFLRSNGFNVDDDMEWVTWPDLKDYTLSLLKWT